MGKEFGGTLIGWYASARRDLPWRMTRDPYRIWLSEVILQQTRVAQGLEYYRRISERFPDVASLAAAHEDEVLKLWQGLGYYSRARSLHAAAKEIVSRFGGIFPKTYEDVLSLKGIGPYTAAAVCSIAYGLPRAAVDGNVYRVLSRVFDIDTPVDTTAGQHSFAELARSLLDTGRAGLYNQAVMEFGALQCLPRSPRCESCPLHDKCLARKHGTIGQRPQKRAKTSVRDRHFNYLHIRHENTALLAQRTGKDIWQGLYEFPLIETAQPVDFEALRQTREFHKLTDGAGAITLLRETSMPKHQLSHQTIHARFYEIRSAGFPPASKEYISVADEAISGYAVSRLMERYFESLG